jgi:hypothetical protein
MKKKKKRIIIIFRSFILTDAKIAELINDLKLSEHKIHDIAFWLREGSGYDACIIEETYGHPLCFPFIGDIDKFTKDYPNGIVWK